MIIFHIYVINHILDYLSTCLRNSQLASCYEPVVDEVGVPVVEDRHLLHQVCDDNVQPPEGEGRGVVLANVQDGAVLATTARDEVVCDVGSTILNETALSSAHSSAVNLDSCSRFLVQKHSMTFTEQVLLQREMEREREYLVKLWLLQDLMNLVESLENCSIVSNLFSSMFLVDQAFCRILWSIQ